MDLDQIEQRMLEIVTGLCRNEEGDYPHDPADCELCLTGPLIEAAIKDEFTRLKKEN